MLRMESFFPTLIKFGLTLQASGGLEWGTLFPKVEVMACCHLHSQLTHMCPHQPVPRREAALRMLGLPGTGGNLRPPLFGTLVPG